ncbi:unnamed protein product [Rhizophagus irregularis]|nr:unnamed protein product [Rhizophagus irregularis]
MKQPTMSNAASSNDVTDHNHQQDDALNINQQSTSNNVLPPQFHPQHINQNFHNNSQQTVIFNNSTNDSVLMQPHTCLNCSSINNSQTRSINS